MTTIQVMDMIKYDPSKGCFVMRSDKPAPPLSLWPKYLGVSAQREGQSPFLPHVKVTSAHLHLRRPAL